MLGRAAAYYHMAAGLLLELGERPGRGAGALRPVHAALVRDVFRGRPPFRPLAWALLRFASEVALPPRLAKIAATARDGSMAGRNAAIKPCTLMWMPRSSSSIAEPSGQLQPCQILRGHLLQRADPLPGDQEPGIPRRHDLDGIAVGHIADCLCPNFGIRFRLAGGERRRVFGVGNLVLSHGRELTSAVMPSRKVTRSRSVAGS